MEMRERANEISICSAGKIFSVNWFPRCHLTPSWRRECLHWLLFSIFKPSLPWRSIQGRTKPRKAGFENLTGNIEFPWQDRISCQTASFFDEICTAASPASGRLLRSLFPWGMTTNWNVRKWNLMQEILKTFFPWFSTTPYMNGICSWNWRGFPQSNNYHAVISSKCCDLWVIQFHF